MPKQIDIFNGDADGICALHQLRLAHPAPEALRITGVKRDIELLQKVEDAADASITVLDISLDKNRSELDRLLPQVSAVEWIDHHFSGDIPPSQKLTTHIDPAPQTCASLIVNALLRGAHTPWAIVGAFGDNLDEVALEKGKEIDLSETDLTALQEIGRLLNYNGYGFTPDDLHIHPEQLYEEVHLYTDPFAFYEQSQILINLRQGYAEDMALAGNLTAQHEAEKSRCFLLPNETWSRRVIGVFSNQIAREMPDKAHAVAIMQSNGNYRISVRAPLSTRQGADSLCRQFPTGGGRAAAAGINALPEELFQPFLIAFSKHFIAS